MTQRTASAAVLLALLLSLPVSAQTFFNEPTGANLGFGGALALADEHVFVGSSPVGWPRGDEPGGVVVQFGRDASGAWVEQGHLKPADGAFGDNFGRVIEVEGTRMVVGAPGAGAAYVFERGDDGQWAEAAKLTPSALAEGAEFGGVFMRGGYRTGVIAISGDRIAVAAYNSDAAAGSVHVFEKKGDRWQETTVLTDDAEGTGFGGAVAMEGDHLAVGAAGYEEGRGTVYTYEFAPATQQWTLNGALSHEMIDGRARLGEALAFHGGSLYAGAPGYQRWGMVLQYEWTDGAWQPVGHLQAGEPAEGERKSQFFGSGIAFSGQDLLVETRGGTVSAFRMREDGVDVASEQVLSASEQRTEPSFGVGIAVSGNLAVVGSPRADYEEGVATVYERDGAQAPWSPAGLLVTDVAHFTSITGGRVACEEGSAEMFACDKVDLISFMSASELASDRGVKMTDIWGWEDPQTNKEYVILGRTDGVAFIDISDPYNPRYVGQMMKTETSPGSGWRDVKVYRDHAFVVADGAEAHGVQIFDLTQLRDVALESMPVTFPETARYEGVHSTHNIVINEETGFAYAVGNRAGGETCGGQLHMINVQDPKNPTFAGCFSHEDAGGTHDSQCVIYRGPDVDYQGKEICFNSNGSSFIIADVSDKEDPETLAYTKYPNLAYTHQGWLTEDQKYFYMNDELDELNGFVGQTRTLIWDVQDLDDPQLVEEFYLDSKASDHNLYVRDNYMYQSNYQAGLRILDITDPVNPVEVGHFDTVPFSEDAPGFGGSWSNYPYFKSGIIAVSSRGEGLFLLKKQEVDM